MFTLSCTHAFIYSGNSLEKNNRSVPKDYNIYFYKHILVNHYLYNLISIRRKPICEVISPFPYLLNPITKQTSARANRVLYAAIYDQCKKESLDVTFFFHKVALDTSLDVNLMGMDIVQIIRSYWWYYLISFFSIKCYNLLQYRYRGKNNENIALFIITSDLEEYIFKMDEVVLKWVV